MAQEPLVHFSNGRTSVYVANVFVSASGDVRILLWCSWVPLASSDAHLSSHISNGLLDIEFVISATGQVVPCSILSPKQADFTVQIVVCETSSVLANRAEQHSADDAPPLEGVLRVKENLIERLRAKKFDETVPFMSPVELVACRWDAAAGHTPIKRSESGKFSSALVTMIKVSYVGAGLNMKTGPFISERLREWVVYHLALGFSHIFVYVDGNAASTNQILEPLIRAGLVSVMGVRRRDVPAAIWRHGLGIKRFDALASQQLVVFSAHYDRYRSYFDYMSVLDVDEFLYANASVVYAGYSMPNTSLLDAFLEYQIESSRSPSRLNKPACVFRLHWWYLFRTPGREIRRVVRDYQSRQTNATAAKRGSSKTIFNAGAHQYLDQHGPTRGVGACTGGEIYVKPEVAHAVHFRATARDFVDQCRLDTPLNMSYMEDTWNRIVPPFLDRTRHAFNINVDDEWIGTILPLG
ncbi:Galactan beta-1,4-galactosyltransferase GALS2 [Porphyridium purpureum]|uniref:Galactan beta-1,4-galactosyltransferase GALS2 n=1 Tax=Porphyridium purpureum TaxID=35688 RepID=A0A5J4Z6U0_PORPP|nr:Galactan beta-1,4-galactosyltransferase GALS2 [Porphyridium purpureum]|eukprot:POR8209..scf295_1